MNEVSQVNFLWVKFWELLNRAFPDLLGALVGVVLGFEFEKWRERNAFNKRITRIAPKIMEELGSNLELFDIWSNSRDQFWAERRLFLNNRMEVYKDDLWRWSIENNGNFLEIYETVEELNYYLQRYGSNPNFTETINTLARFLVEQIIEQTEPFRIKLSGED